MWKLTIILLLLSVQVEMNEITNSTNNSTIPPFTLDDEKRILLVVTIVGILFAVNSVFWLVWGCMKIFKERLGVYELDDQGQSANPVPTTTTRVEIQE